MNDKNDWEFQLHVAKFFTFLAILWYLTIFHIKITRNSVGVLLIIISLILYSFVCFVKFRWTKLSKLYRSKNRELTKEFVFCMENRPGEIDAKVGYKGTCILHEQSGLLTLYYIPFRRTENWKLIKISRFDDEISEYSGQTGADAEVIVIDAVKNTWIRLYKWLHPDSRLEFWDRKEVCRMIYDEMEKNDDKEKRKLANATQKG
ncbi:MAG: hypothetical protein E7222_13070 [Clostridiales bacterium]|nr:hypothetical protein [Clostridiales bacterium]